MNEQGRTDELEFDRCSIYIDGAWMTPKQIEYREKELTMNVEGCARCGGDHQDVCFKPLTRHMATPEGVPIGSHWAPCPENGEPILLTITD